MASGSFEIDTFSWRRCMPLSNDTVPYSSMTMFAAGQDGFLKAYSFYDYTTALKFPDTSTFSTSITSFLDRSLKSTVATLGKSFVSTIPTSNWSSSSGKAAAYPRLVQLPPVDVGPVMSNMINSQQYNVFVESKYSLWLDANDKFTWVSTIGVFGTRPNNSYGRTTTTRVGNSNYVDITTKFMFVPQVFGQQTQIPPFSGNFHLEVAFLSTTNATATTSPAYDLFVPGDNNYTITLMPVTSTIVN